MSDRPRLVPRFKVWVEREGGVALSDWRIELLRAIDRTGSLASAAREMRVPYKTAWYKLKEIETRLGVALVETSSGGASQGSSTLTPLGREVLVRFDDIIAGLEETVAGRFSEKLLPLLDPDRAPPLRERER